MVSVDVETPAACASACAFIAGCKFFSVDVNDKDCWWYTACDSLTSNHARSAYAMLSPLSSSVFAPVANGHL